MQREFVLAQHFPSRAGWGEQVLCLCKRQFPNSYEWAKHALVTVDKES